MIRDFITPRNLTDTTHTLPTIKDLPASLPAADPKAPTLTPTTADDALHVLRGVNHTDLLPPGEFTRTGNATGNQQDYQNLGSLPSADVEAIAELVMMEAAKSAQEDLKSIMDGVKSINKQK